MSLHIREICNLRNIVRNKKPAVLTSCIKHNVHFDETFSLILTT